MEGKVQTLNAFTSEVAPSVDGSKKKFIRRSARCQNKTNHQKNSTLPNASSSEALITRRTYNTTLKSALVNFPVKDNGGGKETSQCMDPLATPATALAIECQKCQKKFGLVSDLEHHLDSIHHAQLHYKCNVCKKQFRTELRFKLHLHKVRKNEVLRGPEGSGMVSGKSGGLSDPNVSIPQENQSTMVCRMCFLKFNTSEERQFHEDNEHNPLAKDDISSHENSCQDSIMSRILIFKRHQCKVCLKRFVTAVELRRHGYLHGEKSASSASNAGCASTMKCSECPLLFTNPIYLRNHRYTHFHSARFQCPECSRRFKRRCHLAEHRNVHRDARPYSCDVCGRSFKLESCLRSHMAVHRIETPFQCSECGKQFKRSASLRQHSFTHGGRVYQCPHCDKAFSAPYNLRAHVAAVHSAKTVDEATNRCHVCGKSFKRARYLKLHSRSHDPSSMHPCPLCPKRYTRPADLKVHLASHGDRRPFVCSACNQSFKTPSNLKRHSLSHCRQRVISKGVETPNEPTSSFSAITQGSDPPQWHELLPVMLSPYEHQGHTGSQAESGFDSSNREVMLRNLDPGCCNLGQDSL